MLVEGFVSAVLDMAPEASVTLLVRKGYDQLAQMFPGRLQWSTTSINPFSQVLGPDDPAVFVKSLQEKAYDLVLFTANSRTWLDDVVGAATASAHRVAMGTVDPAPDRPDGLMDRLGIDPSFPVYDVAVEVKETTPETEKYRLLLGHLAGKPMPLRSPQLLVSGELENSAARVLAELGLGQEEYLLCAPAGTANVSIKAWPQARFAALIARIEKVFGIPALIAGHEQERSVVENVRRLAEQSGAHPKAWLGRDGEMPHAAVLAGKSFAYLGNDTGLMHAAAAFNRPVIAFFGGGHWPRFLPVARTGRVFVTPMPCFYCKWECVFNEALCVRGICLEEVTPEIDDFLQELRDGVQSFRVVEHKVPAADLRDFFERAVRSLDKQKKDLQAERRSFLDQSAELIRLLAESEKDRSNRLEQIAELTKLLLESEKDRGGDPAQIMELTKLVDAAQDVFFKIEASRIYRLARTIGCFDGLDHVISNFRNHAG